MATVALATCLANSSLSGIHHYHRNHVAGDAILTERDATESGLPSPRLRSQFLDSSFSPSAGRPTNSSRRRRPLHPLRAVSSEQAESSPRNQIPATIQELAVRSFREASDACDHELSRLGTAPNEDVVHDLRVAVRRLRSMAHFFAPFAKLPKEFQLRKISALLRVLGAIRDADVMRETLAKVQPFDEQPDESTADLGGGSSNRISSSSSSSIRSGSSNSSCRGSNSVTASRLVDQRLAGLQQEYLQVATEVLRSPSTARLFAVLKGWVESPSFEPRTAAVASAPLSQTAPALLAPHIAELLQHEAWWLHDIGLPRPSPEESPGGEASKTVAANDRATGRSSDSSSSARADSGSDSSGESGLKEEGEEDGRVSRGSERPEAAGADPHLCEVVHDLRKHLREVRYRMELLAPAYPDSSSGGGGGGGEGRGRYLNGLLRVKNLQGVLGDLQDLQVLAAFVEREQHMLLQLLLQQQEEQQQEVSHPAPVESEIEGALANEKGKDKRKKGGGKKGGGGKGQQRHGGSGKLRRGEEEDLVAGVLALREALVWAQVKVWQRWLQERDTVGGDHRAREKIFKSVLRPLVPAAASPPHSTKEEDDEEAGGWAGLIGMGTPAGAFADEAAIALEADVVVPSQLVATAAAFAAGVEDLHPPAAAAAAAAATGGGSGATLSAADPASHPAVDGEGLQGTAQTASAVEGAEGQADGGLWGGGGEAMDEALLSPRLAALGLDIDMTSRSDGGLVDGDEVGRREDGSEKAAFAAAEDAAVATAPDLSGKEGSTRWEGMVARAGEADRKKGGKGGGRGRGRPRKSRAS